MKTFRNYLVGISLVLAIPVLLAVYYLSMRLEHEPLKPGPVVAFLVLVAGFYALAFITCFLSGLCGWLAREVAWAWNFIAHFKSEMEDIPAHAPE